MTNTDKDALVRISGIGPNFIKWFLSGDGKVEDPIQETVLCCHKLLRSSTDKPIIAELGEAETTLYLLFFLMVSQRNGENGALLNNNGYANIFYVYDLSGTLRAVDVSWHIDGWYVNALPFEYPVGWHDGYQVFSRSST